jgi:hypothetical protein
MAGGKFSEALLYGMTIRESANDGSDFSNPAADYRRMFVGEDGLFHLKDSAGTVTTPGVAAGAITSSGLTQATARLLGRTTASTGAIEEITVGTGLSLAAGSLTATGGAGITQSYLGYNTVGGTWETPGVNSKVYWKSITANTAGLLHSVGAYVQHAAGTASGLSCALFTDSSGPSLMIGHGPSSTGPLYSLTATTGRWVQLPLGIWVTAATYWVAVRHSDVGGSVLLQIAYDGSGSDRTATGAANRWDDFAAYTSTTTSNKYSIRASIIS